MVASAEQIGVTVDDRKHAANVERHLLAACLRSEDAGFGGLDDAAAVVAVGDFAAWHHGIVFGAMLAVRATGTPVTCATVYEHLRATGQLAELGENAGGWVADVFDLEPTGALVGYYAGKVKDEARMRALKRAATQVVAELQQPNGPVGEIAARCERLIFDASGTTATADGPRSVADLVRDELRAIDDRAAGTVAPGLATGFREIDALLGGMRSGQLIVVGARPGVGKTSLALGAAANLAAAGVPVLFAGLEMSNAELTQRLLSIRSGVRLTNIREGRLIGDQVDRVYRTAQAVSLFPLHLEDAPNMTADKLAAITRRAVRRNGARLLVVDYLQLIAPENPRENRNAQIGLLARRLKLLARECDIPVMVLSQLNRESANRTDAKPRLSDLRDSGEVEQHADIVLLLSPQSGQPDDAAQVLVDCAVAKNRSGPTGEVTLRYTLALTRFENVAR